MYIIHRKKEKEKTVLKQVATLPGKENIVPLMSDSQQKPPGSDRENRYNKGKKTGKQDKLFPNERSERDACDLQL